LVDSGIICCRVTVQRLVITMAHSNKPLQKILEPSNERRLADVNGFETVVKPGVQLCIATKSAKI